MTGVNDLVSGVIHKIDGIPSSITGSPMIYEFLNDARIDVQNITGDTISESSVAESYQSIIKNLGAAYTISRMTGIGVDYNYSIGAFRIDKGSTNDPNSKQLEFFINMSNKSLKGLGKSLAWGVTFQ